MRKGINISHKKHGGRDQSQVKIKFKKFEKVKSVPEDVPESHNDDRGVAEGGGGARRVFPTGEHPPGTVLMGGSVWGMCGGCL